MAARKIASHNDYVSLEALVESGLSVYQSAKQIGLPLGAFKSANGDREWFEQIKAKEETCRASAVDDLIDRRVQSGEAGDALTKAWAARNHAEYGDKTKLEISGKVEHEHRAEFTVEHLLAVARERGLLEQFDGQLEGTVPAPRAIPAGPSGSAERTASPVPDRQES